MCVEATSQLEIVQQQKGGGGRIVGPLEDLDRADMEMLLQQRCLDIRTVNNYESFFRAGDLVMTDGRTIELWELRDSLILATVLKSMIRRHPQFGQLLSWLHQDVLDEKRETYIREVQVPCVSEQTEGPEVLDGADLLFAMNDAPRLVPSKEETDQDEGDMSHIDDLFDMQVDELREEHNNHKVSIELELTEVVERDRSNPRIDYARLDALEEELLTEAVDFAIDHAVVDQRAEDWTIVKGMMERIHGRPWNHTP